ncbi:unnamed protein product [Didymodactylos carnosus]|uniref:Nuclear receptor domain-containing protein n=1 Tax=Didymodactylos carnosus TaxID=1234261 RepID=A0A814HBN0_9BILA|nr:unnamed protein product [Didymodactylos carnosus]CAF3778681.1 unnamed protein product [Didymodactylos carnosus]
MVYRHLGTRDIWAQRHLGARHLGATSFGRNDIWAHVIWAHVIWAQRHLGARHLGATVVKVQWRRCGCGWCEVIESRTQRHCDYCRLKVCVEDGMSKELVCDEIKKVLEKQRRKKKNIGQNETTQFKMKCVCNMGDPPVEGPCDYCRLKVCFESGMPKDIISLEIEKILKDQRIKKNEPENTSTALTTIRPVNLLHNDTSRLTELDWMYLTNISNVYDHYCCGPVSRRIRIHHKDKNQILIPFRARCKLQRYLDFTSDNLSSLISFFKHIPEFRHLPDETKTALLQRNLRHSAGDPAEPRYVVLGGVEGRLMDFQGDPPSSLGGHHGDLPYSCGGRRGTGLNIIEPMRSCNIVPWEQDYLLWEYVYGAGILTELKENTSYVDSLLKEPLLIKLILITLIFSTNFSPTTFDDKYVNYRYTPSTTEIFYLQNFYLRLLWGFMLYRFGETQTIAILSKLIRLLLKVLRLANIVDQHFEERHDLNKIIELTQSIVRI